MDVEYKMIEVGFLPHQEPAIPECQENIKSIAISSYISPKLPWHRSLHRKLTQIELNAYPSITREEMARPLRAMTWVLAISTHVNELA